MFWLTKKLIGLLTGLVNGFNHTKCISLSNQRCMIQPTLIYLHLNYYSQELYYYSFAVNPNLGGRGEGKFTRPSPCWVSLSNSQTVKAVTLAFRRIQ